VSDKWLPVGYLASWELHVEKRELPNAGDFTAGGWKLCWHTTEGTNVDAMWNVLRAKDAAPHFIIGFEDGREKPSVIQCIPLDQAARALQHPAGTLETNRANVIQVEICEFAENADNWSDKWYRALASLACLIEHRVGIARVSNHSFITPNRLTPSGWIRARGHVGHVHCPNNDHWDPGKLRATHLLNLMDEIDH